MFKFQLGLSHDHSKHVTDEQFNTVSHLVAAMFSLLGASLLLARLYNQPHDLLDIIAVSVYGLSVFALFTLSTLHHGVKASRKVMKVLRTLDYSGVFFLIAGTVTPLCLLTPRKSENYAVLAVVWALAAGGIALRASISHLPKHITNTMFITLGWIPVALLLTTPQMLNAAGTFLLALGGLFYSFGFVIYSIEKPNPRPGKFGFHEIWHIAVILGALCHFFVVYTYLLAN